MSAQNSAIDPALSNPVLSVQLAEDYLYMPSDVAESFKYLLISHRSRPFSKCRGHFSDGDWYSGQYLITRKDEPGSLMVLLKQSGGCPCADRPLQSRISLYKVTDEDCTTGVIPPGRESIWNKDSQHCLPDAQAFLDDPNTVVLSGSDPHLTCYKPFAGQDWPRASQTAGTSKNLGM